MSIYTIAKDQFLANIEEAHKLLSFYEIFDLFIDHVPTQQKKQFFEDIKDKMIEEGYTILKARNLQEKMKLEEIAEEMYPYYNERMFL